LIFPRSCVESADKNTFNSQRPDVKNGWLVRDENNPAFTPATRVIPASNVMV
jgi:hypothetical protein